MTENNLSKNDVNDFTKDSVVAIEEVIYEVVQEIEEVEEMIQEAIEELIEEVIEIELYAKRGEIPPKGKRYKIRVDKEHYIVTVSKMSGREILLLACKTPPERFRLDQKFKGGATKKIELNEIVDFTTPGVERFMTLPLDQTEG